jgi:protein tyrosine/serine phosphatase
MAAMNRACLGLSAAAALLAGCATSEVGVYNVHTVTPGILIRGGQPDEEGFRELRESYGITTVVNLHGNTAERERAWVTALGIKYIAMPSNAFEPDEDTTLEFLRIVAEAADGEGPVFIHCRQGMDRTGTAVAAYRVALEGWTAAAAIDELHRYQEPLNDIMFAGIIPPFIRGIERDRAGWLARLQPAGPQIVESDRGMASTP